MHSPGHLKNIGQSLPESRLPSWVQAERANPGPESCGAGFPGSEISPSSWAPIPSKTSPCPCKSAPSPAATALSVGRATLSRPVALFASQPDGHPVARPRAPSPLPKPLIPRMHPKPRIPRGGAQPVPIWRRAVRMQYCTHWGHVPPTSMNHAQQTAQTLREKEAQCGSQVQPLVKRSSDAVEDRQGPASGGSLHGNGPG